MVNPGLNHPNVRVCTAFLNPYEGHCFDFLHTWWCEIMSRLFCKPWEGCETAVFNCVHPEESYILYLSKYSTY